MNYITWIKKRQVYSRDLNVQVFPRSPLNGANESNLSSIMQVCLTNTSYQNGMLKPFSKHILFTSNIMNYTEKM